MKLNKNRYQLLIIVILGTTCIVQWILLMNKKNNTSLSIPNEVHLLGTHSEIDTIDSGPKVIGTSEMSDIIPSQGCVFNQETAIKIAEAVWLPLYGKMIYEELPFNTLLIKDSIWIVTGTLPDGMLGGTAFLKMRKQDGKILMVTHYK